MTVFSAGGIIIHPDSSGAGKKFADFLLHLLGTRAEISNVFSAAFRAYSRRLHGMSAVMALKQSVCFCHVISHTDIAVRAFHHISAAAAADKGVVSAPVHKQHRLFSVPDTVFQCFSQLSAQYCAVAVFQLFTHVDDFNFRKRAVFDASGHFKQHIISASGTRKTQDTRCCACKDQCGILLLAPGTRDFTRVISRMMVAEISAFMLLVHHNQSEIPDR